MLLGYNTNGLAHHDPLDAIDLLADLGYRSVALTIDHGTLTPFGNTYLADAQAEQIKKKLSQYQMRSVIETGARFLLEPRTKHEPTLISAEPKGRDLRFEFLRHCIDTATNLGSDCVSLWSGCLLDKTIDDKAAMDRLVVSLKPVIEYAEEQNVILGFEPEPGMLIDTLDQYEMLRDRIDSSCLQLTLDLGHLHCQNEVPIADRIVRYADQIVNIHIEDMKRGVHEHLKFGEGEMDFPPIFKALKAINYRGALHVELSRHSHEGPTAAEEAMHFLRPLIAS